MPALPYHICLEGLPRVQPSVVHNSCQLHTSPLTHLLLCCWRSNIARAHVLGSTTSPCCPRGMLPTLLPRCG